MPCPSCDALAILAAPYRLEACIQQRWKCPMCGMAGLISTKIGAKA
jgi:transposase-like protein